MTSSGREILPISDLEHALVKSPTDESPVRLNSKRRRDLLKNYYGLKTGTAKAEENLLKTEWSKREDPIDIGLF